MEPDDFEKYQNMIVVNEQKLTDLTKQAIIDSIKISNIESGYYMNLGSSGVSISNASISSSGLRNGRYINNSDNQLDDAKVTLDTGKTVTLKDLSNCYSDFDRIKEVCDENPELKEKFDSLLATIRLIDENPKPFFSIK